VRFQDWATFVVLLVTGSLGVQAMRKPHQGRLFWVCALVCAGCLGFLLVLEASQPG
jgi:UDP-N-acetylmuramyl pentapeptide phosphotransferase/UDP-N-acetylglucosamine-1-phosphate transferase